MCEDDVLTIDELQNVAAADLRRGSMRWRRPMEGGRGGAPSSFVAPARYGRVGRDSGYAC